MTALGTYYALTPTAATTQSVATIAALRGLTPSTNALVLVEGYYAAGDGSVGEFYGVTGAAPGTYVDNAGTVIVPTGGNGSAAWLRAVQPSEPVDVRWFGPTADGTTTLLSSKYASLAAAQAFYPFVTALTQTVDWAAIQAAIIYASAEAAAVNTTQYGIATAMRKVVVSKGTYSVKDAIVWRKYTSITLAADSVVRADAAMTSVFITPTYTSTTSQAIVGSGSVTLTINVANTSPLATMQVGDAVSLVDATNPTNWIKGTLGTYSGTSITVTVSGYGGTGTITSWIIASQADRASNQYFFGPGTIDCNNTNLVQKADCGLYVFNYSQVTVRDINIINAWVYGARFGSGKKSALGEANQAYNLQWFGGMIRFYDTPGAGLSTFPAGYPAEGTPTSPGSVALRCEFTTDSYIMDLVSVGGAYGFWGGFASTVFTNCHPYGVFICPFHTDAGGTSYVGCYADLAPTFPTTGEANCWHFVGPDYLLARYRNTATLVDCFAAYGQAEGIPFPSPYDPARDALIRSENVAVYATGCFFYPVEATPVGRTFKSEGTNKKGTLATMRCYENKSAITTIYGSDRMARYIDTNVDVIADSDYVLRWENTSSTGNGSAIAVYTPTCHSTLRQYENNSAYLEIANSQLIIQTNDARPIVFAPSGTNRAAFAAGGNFYPYNDNTNSCGASGKRWTEIWAANGTINTSDANAKIDVEPANLGLDFINNLNPVSYRMKIRQNLVEKISEPKNGEPAEIKITPLPGIRKHYGLIAQEVKAALPEGVDFGGWIQTDLNDPNSEQGLRYDEFIAPLIKAVQELSEKVKDLQAEINELKA